MLSSIETLCRLISVAEFLYDNIKEVSHLVEYVVISPAFRYIALVKEMKITHYLQEPVAGENFTNPNNGHATMLVAPFYFHHTSNLGKANSDNYIYEGFQFIKGEMSSW